MGEIESTRGCPNSPVPGRHVPARPADRIQLRPRVGIGAVVSETPNDIFPGHTVAYCTADTTTTGPKLETAAIACAIVDQLPPSLPRGRWVGLGRSCPQDISDNQRQTTTAGH